MAEPPPPRSAIRVGLRSKLMLVSLVLVFVPLLVVWSIGTYEDLARDHSAGQVREIAEVLKLGIAREKISLAAPGPSRGWLAARARTHHVMIRLIDARGEVVFRTRPIDAEPWSNLQRGWYRRAGDFFFGPTGPPDLMAHEETLPPPGRRPEVRRALAGQAAETWRLTGTSNMNVFYRAVPVEGQPGAIYLTRVARRSIRALYDLRYQLLKLTLILAGFAAVMGLWVGWRFVNPLVHIQRAIRTYLQNPAEIDPDQLALRRGDEIGDLSRDLRKLTGAMKQRLEQTAEIAADLAHDLKNPIATVSATSELLDSSEAIDADRKQRLSRAMRAAAGHMNRSVDGMLALARLDQRLASGKRAPVNLSRLLQDLLGSYEADPAAGHVTFDAAIEPGVHIAGAAEQLEQLARCLIDNATIFCERAVAVRLGRDGSHITLSVDDDGPGVSAGNREKLFRRFFTARSDDLPPGTGLGLAIARTIARAHAGEIVVGERGALSGASFVVRLPAGDARK